ncbi:unnamed protein product [Dibothriocephalus latus]|uniref:Reverse transcriptase domain-containing protein n=1 Tax=Dibothriocephalus latus TaxID=60516 RepID=A0A3P7P7E1_DIBLA|nr:unnamed protein product [Dibothriocephalus latus]
MANLLYCLELWTQIVDEGNTLLVVYIDFKKAFSFISPQRLLHKRSRLDSGGTLKWIRSFPLGRSQAVRVGDQQSAAVAVENRVPEGSASGATMFIIHVNDCVRELDCDIAMFSDDIKNWSVIKKAADKEHLLADPNRFQTWSKDWLLPLNEDKYSILRVGRPSFHNLMVYCLNGVQPQEVDAQKYLRM